MLQLPSKNFQKISGGTFELMDEKLISTDDAGVSLVFYQKMKADNYCVIADCRSSELREGITAMPMVAIMIKRQHDAAIFAMFHI